MDRQNHRPQSPALNPLFRMGNILQNNIEFEHVRDFVKTIVNSGKRSGIDETQSLTIIKNYFSELSDAIFNACSEYYNTASLSHVVNVEVQDRLLEVSEVAEILRVTPTYVRKLINTGKISAQNFGQRMTRIKESDLKKYQENKSS